MNRFHPLFLLLLLIPAFSIAQNNYKPGYIVRLNGDTVKGYVNYKEWDKNPSAILFKTDLGSSIAESVTPANISSFAVTGLEYFKSFNVHITTAQVDMMNIKQGIDTNYITSTVFLKILTDGNNCTLFTYKDDIKTRYYVLDKTTVQPVELIYRQYYRPDDATFVRVDNTFQIQLRALTQKYNVVDPKLQADIGSAQYTDMDMIKIIQKINGNKSKQFTSKNLSAIRWYAGAGTIYNSVKFTGAINFPSASNSTFPSIDAGFDVIFNKQTQKVFLRLEISATANQHSYYNPPDYNGYSYGISNVKQTTESISPQVFYNFFNSNKLQAFISGGFSANLSSYNNYYFYQTYVAVAVPPVNEFPNLSHLWVSYPFKAGLIIDRKLEFYVGYIPSTQITGVYVTFVGNATQYQAGMNYLFSIK